MYLSRSRAPACWGHQGRSTPLSNPLPNGAIAARHELTDFDRGEHPPGTHTDAAKGMRGTAPCAYPVSGASGDPRSIQTIDLRTGYDKPVLPIPNGAVAARHEHRAGMRSGTFQRYSDALAAHAGESPRTTTAKERGHSPATHSLSPYSSPPSEWPGDTFHQAPGRAGPCSAGNNRPIVHRSLLLQ